MSVGNGEVPGMTPMLGLPFVDLKIVYKTINFSGVKTVLFYKRSLGLQRVRLTLTLTLTSAAQRYAPSE